MAHFAKLDENNVVTQIIIVANECAPDEKTGQEFLASIGFEGTWVQTSYNTREGVHLLGGTPLRYRYAGIGYLYDPVKDVFLSAQPYPSWTLNETAFYWEPPTPRPEGTETTGWNWNENTLFWEPFTKSIK
jgi:hypothetical protein